MAHDKKISSKDLMARQRETSTKEFRRGKSPESFRGVVHCYRCGSERHRAAECMHKMPEGHRRDGQQGRIIPCNRCEALGHTRDCCSTSCNQQILRFGPIGGKPSWPSQRMGCTVPVRKQLPQVGLMKDS